MDLYVSFHTNYHTVEAHQCPNHDAHGSLFPTPIGEWNLFDCVKKESEETNGYHHVDHSKRNLQATETVVTVPILFKLLLARMKQEPGN